MPRMQGWIEEEEKKNGPWGWLILIGGAILLLGAMSGGKDKKDTKADADKGKAKVHVVSDR